MSPLLPSCRWKQRSESLTKFPSWCSAMALSSLLSGTGEFSAWIRVSKCVVVLSSTLVCFWSGAIMEGGGVSHISSIHHVCVDQKSEIRGQGWNFQLIK